MGAAQEVGDVPDDIAKLTEWVAEPSIWKIGELSRAIGRTWRDLWPRVRKLEEPKDVGRALSPEEQQKLLDGLKGRRTPRPATLVPLLLLTGMRVAEALSLTWLKWNR